MMEFTLTKHDLELELWLRKRNSGELVWTTRDGTRIPLKDMEEGHLKNALRMLKENSFLERNAFLEAILLENQDVLDK